MNTALRLGGKILAGVLLIAATVFAVLTILAYFPNKMPAPGQGEDAWYSGVRYKMTLVECYDSTSQKKKTDTALLSSLARKIDTITNRIKTRKLPNDSLILKKDSIELKRTKDSLIATEKIINQKAGTLSVGCADKRRIHLNTILLILVAAMGFLGNMVHIASSFTSFVGNGTFEERWILWYFVKPFTAAGLAVLVYFVIRAGFMGAGSDAGSINLYGVLALSALTGLFTDNATLKLKEVFDVIFKPKDERGDRLTDFKIKISSVIPAKLDVNNPNQISVKGENLNKKKLVIKIEGKSVPKLSTTEDSIDFTYSVDAADKTKTSFDIFVTDEAGKENYYKGKFTV